MLQTIFIKKSIRTVFAGIAVRLIKPMRGIKMSPSAARIKMVTKYKAEKIFLWEVS